MISALSIIAQVEAAPPDFSGWLANGMYLVGTVGGVLWVWTLIRDLRTKKEETPQPFVVSTHTPPVTKADFDEALRQAHGRMNREKAARAEEVSAMKEATEALREKVDREVDAMRATAVKNHEAGEARANRIHDRIDTIGKAVADMPQTIVGLLRNAKDLSRSSNG